jgi:hypothetical protein
MSNLKIEFTDKEITAWGGISILQKMMEKMSFVEELKMRLYLRRGQTEDMILFSLSLNLSYLFGVVQAGMNILKLPVLMV